MKYRRLGHTDMEVSTLSLGASPFGGVFGEMDEQECLQTLFTALDSGINFIDVSPYYGNTRAESVLGKGLRQLPRENYFLATKVGRYGDAEFDFSKKRVTQSIDESLKRLQVDHIDLIQCHDIEFSNLQQIVHETIPALRKSQSQGKARYIGFTGLPLKLFPAVLDQSKVDTVLSYCHYTLIDASLKSLIPYLQQKHVGIINASPFAMGLLTEQGPPAWHPAPDFLKETCAQTAAFLRQQTIPIAKLALQFSLSNPAVHTTLVGCASIDQLLQNLRWMNEPLNEADLAAALRLLKPIKNQTWPSGLPENN